MMQTSTQKPTRQVAVLRYIVPLLFALAMGAAPDNACAEYFSKRYSHQENDIARTVHFAIRKADPDFEALENFARELRAKVASQEAYESALGYFYGFIGLDTIDTEGKAILIKWKQKYPTSPTPVLAILAQSLYDHIEDFYYALGINWVWHEPPGARAAFESVRTELLKVKPFAADDPYWYQLMAKAIIALRRDKAELDEIVEEGMKRHPGNYGLIVTAAAGHLSKWGGSAESLENFAQRVLALSSHADGLANYARVYNVALRAQYGALLFDVAKPNWQLLMSSVRDLMARSPSDVHLNVAAVLACAGGNRDLTRTALMHADFVYNSDSWAEIGTTYHPYEFCRQWAGEELPGTVGAKRNVPTANP